MAKLMFGCLSFFVLMGGFADTGFTQRFHKTQSGLTAVCGSTSISLEVYKPDVIRVIKCPDGGVFKKASLSVTASPDPAAAFSLQKNDKGVLLLTDSLSVQLDLLNGNLLFSDSHAAALLREVPAPGGFSPDTGADAGSYKVSQSFALDSDEVIYGLGEQQNGRLDQRHQVNLLAQQNMKVAIPFFQSKKGYGIFWDNYSPTLFSDTLGLTTFRSDVAKGIDYYFLKGSATDSMVGQMRYLTGKVPMLPLWVYGYNQSRERYKTQFELMDVVKKYRELKVPLDGIIQDWQYWGKDSNWNAMQFDPATYPRPRAMVDSVHQLNAHIFVVAWPGFGPETRQYKAFKRIDALMGFDTWPPNSGAKVYDVYDPSARDLYWKYLNKGVFSLGVDAWWLDSSEPDHINEKDSDFDEDTYLGTYRSVRNAFPLEHVRGVYEHQRKVSTKKRVVILTRSAFAGQQRYGANTWSGDVHSDWETFARQIPAGLNFSLTGLPYWNTDIGGFFAGGFNKGGGAKNPAFQQLYTRWFQFGTFMPMMRSHGTGVPREIYQFGKAGDTTFDVLNTFIHLRYHLLPYIYATAWNVSEHNGSFMRPLSADFSADAHVLKISDQYLFGSSFLVAPVTQKDATEQRVYLPAGASWFDFWTGDTLKGGQYIQRKVPISIMPLYVKAGAIIPWGPDVQFATEKSWDNLQIRVYPGRDGKFVLYEDENDNYNYEKGMYSEIPFHWDERTGVLTIGPRTGQFPGMLTSRHFNIVLVDKGGNGTGVALSKIPTKRVIYTGGELKVALR